MISADHAREIRAKMEQLSAALDDTEALQVPEMFARWSADESYVAGDRRRYQGVLYKCLQAHDAQDAWNPADAASLWARVLIPDPEVIPEWVQPDSTNPYMQGDKVTHNGKTWVSLVDYNVWEPSESVPSLWTEVTA